MELRVSSTSLVSARRALRHSTAASKGSSCERPSKMIFSRAELIIASRGISRIHDVMH
jgi:hypothetical protein